MKITVFAATGGIGRQLLDQAITAGHGVTAVVRDPARLNDERVRCIQADLSATDSETRAALESAVEGAQGVVSGLGQRSAADVGIAFRGTQAIVEAMKATDARRLVVVSAAPNSTMPSPGNPHPPRDPGEGFFMRTLLTPIIKVVLKRVYTDLALMEDLVRESGLDWTIVRPPRLTDKPLTGNYRTAVEQSLRGGGTISRADVADLMLKALHWPDTIGYALGAAY